MDIYALDENFKLIDIGIPYANLQWNRRYYDFGDFMMEVPLPIYNPEWAYIGTSERPELGRVQKVLLYGDTDVSVLISGYFCESFLNDKTVYPRYIGDAAHTETALRTVFEKYKDDIPVILGEENDPPLGDRTQSNFSDDLLGTKFYRICESREISYRITYDYQENQLKFSVWEGKDRTQSQSENSYQVFSSEFGNIASKNINIDNSDYKNYAIIPCNGDEDNVEQNTFYLDMSDGKYRRKIVFDYRSEKPEENESLEDFEARILESATERLLGYLPVQELDIDPASDQEYMVDYDLGDKCDVVLSDIELQFETRIVEVLEVFNTEGHSITVGLGNRRISNLGRLANSI